MTKDERIEELQEQLVGAKTEAEISKIKAKLEVLTGAR